MQKLRNVQILVNVKQARDILMQICKNARERVGWIRTKIIQFLTDITTY